MNTYEIIITIVVAVFGSTGLWTFIQNRLDAKSSHKQLLLGIAYLQIIEACEIYIDKGWIDINEYEEIYKFLYVPYTEMGGNGTAKALMEKVKKLPNKPPKE